MKRLSFLIIAATIFAAWGYSNTTDGIITMTTSAERAAFKLKGSGTAIVDWGDDSEKQTVELELIDEYGWTQRISHTYSDTIPRTITISGENITGLNCAPMCVIFLGGRNTSCNQFITLDVSRNTVLSHLDCRSNQLTELDVSKNTALTYLNCGENQLTELDVSKNTALTFLVCNENQLTALDVSRNTALTLLHCRRNQLTTLNVSQNSALERLHCGDNQLTVLDVSRNTSLIELGLDDNQLTALNVSQNPALVILYCMNNQLTADALNFLFGTLHDNIITFISESEGEQIARKIIIISNNPGYTVCDQSILDAKGWKTSW